MAHCWESGPFVCPHKPPCDPTCQEPMSTTCMAEDGHTGPHDFVRDDQIEICFAPNPPVKPKEES